MGVWDFLLLLLVAAIIGAIAEGVAGFSFGGLGMSIVVGFIGAVVGHWLQSSFHIPELLPVRVAGHTFPVLCSVLGGVLFVLLLRVLLARRTYIVS